MRDERVKVEVETFQLFHLFCHRPVSSCRYSATPNYSHSHSLKPTNTNSCFVPSLTLAALFSEFDAFAQTS